MVLFDEAFPEYGAIAVFRTIALPKDMDADSVHNNVITQILREYGENGKVSGQLMWVSDNEARMQAEVDPKSIEACGSPELEIGPMSDQTAESNWDAGAGPRLKDKAIDAIAAKCGDVLRVDYDGGDHISLALWNSDYIFDRRAPMMAKDAEGEIPKLKF